jgi:hypothetical protein
MQARISCFPFALSFVSGGSAIYSVVDKAIDRGPHESSGSLGSLCENGAQIVELTGQQMRA